MPQEIPLQAVPNQLFNIQLNNVLYNFSIKLSVNIMGVSIARAQQVLLTNVIAKPNSIFAPTYPIIPYSYLENNQGNFFIFTENEEYPFYTQFGTTQFMLYYSPDEMEALRENN